MKKLKIGVKGVKETLSREELKQILGGVNGSGGSGGGCIRCTTNSGMSSCYYTIGSPEELCERVYPNQQGRWETVYNCADADCIKN